jgi:hypothetical protein
MRGWVELGRVRPAPTKHACPSGILVMGSELRNLASLHFRRRWRRTRQSVVARPPNAWTLIRLSPGPDENAAKGLGALCASDRPKVSRQRIGAMVRGHSALVILHLFFARGHRRHGSGQISVSGGIILSSLSSLSDISVLCTDGIGREYR